MTIDAETVSDGCVVFGMVSGSLDTGSVMFRPKRRGEVSSEDHLTVELEAIPAE